MSLARRFVHDQSGAVAALTGVALIALVGIGGLAYDVSRALALRAELESAVDAAALAGASQLDGGTDAMGRAQTAAMGSLVGNRAILADTYETNVLIDGISFLSAFSPDVATTVSADARFIRISLPGRSLGLVFGMLTGAGGFNASAHAVAGYGTAICKVPPLMICNPDEATSLTFDGNAYIGRSFLLTPPPASGGWGPGNFGFLSVGSGAADVKNAMGRNPPLTECFGTSVQTQTGNIASADDWFNTRFDIYAASAGTNKNDAFFAPAMNTMIGTKTNAGASACSPTVSAPGDSCASSAAVATGMGFPLDCGQGNAKIGSGVWNVAQYFATNHSGITPGTYVPEIPAGATGSGWAAYGPATAAGGTTPTRYQVYQWELAMLSGTIAKPAGAFSDGQTAVSGSNDYAAPQCNKLGAQATPDRRAISVVVVNCLADDVHGSMTVNVISYVDLFLTAPAHNGSIYGEVIGATTDTSAVGEETMLYSVRLYE